MNTCDTCKWWRDKGEMPGTRRCNNSGENGSEHTVGGGEPYNAGDVETGPEFGCIHHEPKAQDERSIRTAIAAAVMGRNMSDADRQIKIRGVNPVLWGQVKVIGRLILMDEPTFESLKKALQ